MPRLNSIYHSVSNTPGTSGAFTVGSAVDATWGVPPSTADGKTYRLRVSETGLGTEILQSTYTHSGTSWSRGTLESASRLNFTSAAKVAVVETAADFDRFDRILRGVTPGGRLTLESGVPVSTTDQTAKTSIFYTPYLHDQIVLWDGVDWVPATFTEYTLALGTLTSARPYDVFAYLSGGALALEMLAWTNDTTRATAVTLQDGRYCKSGDKTRLLLGSFYTTSTTTTEDSEAARVLGNVYNVVERRLLKRDATPSWTYNTATFRPYNNSTGNRATVMSPVGSSLVKLGIIGYVSNSAGQQMYISIGKNSTTSNSEQLQSGNAGVAALYGICEALFDDRPAAGYTYYQILEKGGASGTSTFFGDNGAASVRTGMMGTVLA